MKKKIIVLGGGLSGLAAAEKLCKKYDVTILEKDKILGGLAKSFNYKGKWIPITYHHVMQLDNITKEYIKKYKLEKYLLWKNIEMAFWFNNKGYPLTTPFHILSFKPFKLLDKINLVKLGIYCRFKKDWSAYKGIRADIWLDKFVGKRVRKILFDNLAQIKFGKLSSVDCAWFGARLHEAAKNREKYSYLTCGFHALVTALEKDIIKKEGVIKTNANVLKISKNEVLVKINGKNQKIKYDKIISSLPPELFAEKSNLSSKIKYELNKIKYKPVICMVIGSKNLISKYYWNIFIKPLMRFGGIFNHTALYSKGGIDNENLYYIFAYVNKEDKFFNINEKRIEQEFIKDIKLLCPKFKLSWSKTFKIRYASPVFASNYKNLPIKISDKMYLTGVYKEHPATRTMHTALKSGIKTANYILNEI